MLRYAVTSKRGKDSVGLLIALCSSPERASKLIEADLERVREEAEMKGLNFSKERIRVEVIPGQKAKEGGTILEAQEVYLRRGSVLVERITYETLMIGIKLRAELLGWDNSGGKDDLG